LKSTFPSDALRCQVITRGDNDQLLQRSLPQDVELQEAEGYRTKPLPAHLRTKKMISDQTFTRMDIQIMQQDLTDKFLIKED
jgi:hypothetical protein